MRLAIVIVLAIAIAFLMVEARSFKRRRGTWKTRRCTESKKINCKYAKKCVRAGVKCIRHITVRRCARFGLKRIHRISKKRVCIRFARFRIRGARCGRCARWGYRAIKTFGKKTVCLRYHKRRICKKTRRFCKKSRAVKRCWVVDHKFKLYGPKRCRKGFYLKFVKRGRTIRRRCVRGVRVIKYKSCTSALDPHTLGYNKRWFEFQVAGDYVMADTTDGVFALHQRLKRFSPAWTGTVGMAVLVNGRDVVEYLGHGKFFLNGKALHVNFNSQVNLPQGGSILKKRHGHQVVVEVFSPNGAKAIYHDFGPYANLLAFIPTYLHTRGYCSQRRVHYWMKTTAKGLFSYALKIKYTNRSMRRLKRKLRFTRAQKKRALIRCRATGVRGALLKDCVKDVLVAGGKPGAARRILKIIRDIRAEVRQGLRARPLRIARRR